MTDEQQGWDEPEEPEVGQADDDAMSDAGSRESSSGTEPTDEPRDSTADEVGDPGREA
jgi:hypothetical protein